MRLFKPQEIEEKRLAKEQELKRRLIDAEKLVEKKEEEARIKTGKLLKESQKAEEDLNKYLLEVNSKRVVAETALRDIKVQLADLQDRPKEIRWQKKKIEAEVVLEELKVMEKVMEEREKKLNERERGIESRITLVQDKLDMLADREIVISRSEDKSKVLAESLASQEKELTKRLASFAAIREEGLAKIEAGKKDNSDLMAAIKVEKELLAEKQEEIKKDRLHLESQQQTLKIAYDNARAKNLL